MKYIPVDKLITEIKRQKDFYHERGNGSDNAIEEELDDLLSFIISLQQEQQEVELFECPKTPIKDAIEVTSRMKYIDEELKPIAEFIMDYASWNLHKDEWNQPVIEVPLFRVLDAFAQKGKPYCCAG